VIPEFEDDEGASVAAFESVEVGKLLRSQETEAVAIAGARGTRANGFPSVVVATRAASTVHRKEGVTVQCDRQMIAAISMRAARGGLPVAQVRFAGSRADQVVVLLDWG
jgi:hypothetical protein